MEPVVLRHVALGDGDEAGEPRFRRQQIVERAVGAARTVGVGEPVADREDAPAAIVEEAEPHLVGEQRGAARQRVQDRLVLLVWLGGPAHAGDRSPAPESRRRDRRRPRRRSASARPRAMPASCCPSATQWCAARRSRIASRAAAAICAREALIVVTVAARRRSPGSLDEASRQHLGGVDQALETLRSVCGCVDELQQALRQGDQRAGEVAAVDRRDVVRPQRRQRRRVVPVQEVAVVALEALERGQRPVEPFEQRRRSTGSRGRARPASRAGSSPTLVGDVRWASCGSVPLS